MERYGIPMARRIIARDVDAAVAAAQELGYPVVVKMDGPSHKTSLGGVALGLNSADDVATAARVRRVGAGRRGGRGRTRGHLRADP